MPKPNERLSSGGIRCLALVFLSAFASPAHAVIEQVVEYPSAQQIQGGTLRLDSDPNQEYVGEVGEDDDGRKLLVFQLPDSANGENATLEATVDGRRDTRSVVVTGSAFAILTTSLGTSGNAGQSGFFFGGGVGVSQVSVDVAANLASTSARDGTNFLTGSGLQNIVATSAGDDGDWIGNFGMQAGFRFANDSQLYLDLQTSQSADFGLNSNVTGNVPGVDVTAQSLGNVEIELWSGTLNYSRYFGQSTNFRYVASLGAIVIDRKTSFTSTLEVNNTVTDSFSGGDDLDDSQLFFGAALEWAPRKASGWQPVVGFGVFQSGKSGDLEEDAIVQMGLYFRGMSYSQIAKSR